jgi:hypothetical protein
MRNYTYLSILVKALRFLSTFARRQQEHFTNTIRKNAYYIWASELEQYAGKIENSAEAPELIKDVELTEENLREAIKIAEALIEQLKQAGEDLGKELFVTQLNLPESAYNQLMAMAQKEIDNDAEGPVFKWNEDPWKDFAKTYLKVPDDSIDNANAIDEAFQKAFASIPEDAQKNMERNIQEMFEIEIEKMYLEKALQLLNCPPEWSF